jgi:hypothetical protein
MDDMRLLMDSSLIPFENAASFPGYNARRLCRTPAPGRPKTEDLQSIEESVVTKINNPKGSSS